MLINLDRSRELPLKPLDRLPTLADDAPNHVLGALELLGDALAKLSVVRGGLREEKAELERLYAEMYEAHKKQFRPPNSLHEP